MGNAKADMSPRKMRRNGVYIGCGITTLACLALLLTVDLLPDSSPILAVDPVFWLEAIALFAFGASWLIKGEVLLGDRPGIDSAP